MKHCIHLKLSLILLLSIWMLHPCVAQEDPRPRIRMAIDSVLQKLETEKNETSRVSLLISIHSLRIQGFPEIYLEIGQSLLTLSQNAKDPIMEANAWSFLGQGYRLSGNYTKGLECHHKAVALAEKAGNKSILALAQNEMAHIYKDREENEKAIALYLLARHNAFLGDHKNLHLWPEMNMGAIYLGLNRLDSSLYYSALALEGFRQLNNQSNNSYIETNIAGAYSKLGDNVNAMIHFKKAIEDAFLVESARYKNIVYVALAEHFLRNQQPDSCAYYAKKAIAVVERTAFTFLSIKPAKILTDLYENTNADSTIKYLKIYRTANDSLFSSRANQELRMMTFEEDQRQQEIELQKVKFQNKIRMNMLFGGLGTFLLIALILYRNNRQKHKTNQLLGKTLDDLKATQAQLIQSEKMASLGELTAGIAHEIQNPLNFVNNFAEVNTELIDEMTAEISRGNLAELQSIAGNIKDNEQKIAYHGKRADAIVKSMLQHSRTSAGKKELTDINALADEYLRLAYHGFRAKDKSFNVQVRTDFDPSLPLINIVPQDIGRVLLNLINNAFQAVSGPQPSPPQPPEGGFTLNPIVIVSTRYHLPPLGGKGGEGIAGKGGEGIAGKGGEPRWAEIRVSDNGPGIPAHLLDKIFQPFFTTKPTGQGTGLGLSLSYDIVKAHGGELKVETKEGEGTEFILSIPVVP